MTPAQLKHLVNDASLSKQERYSGVKFEHLTQRRRPVWRPVRAAGASGRGQRPGPALSGREGLVFNLVHHCLPCAQLLGGEAAGTTKINE